MSTTPTPTPFEKVDPKMMLQVFSWLQQNPNLIQILMGKPNPSSSPSEILSRSSSPVLEPSGFGMPAYTPILSWNLPQNPSPPPLPPKPSTPKSNSPTRQPSGPYRTPYTVQQLKILEESFEKSRFSTGEAKKELVRRTGLSSRQIKVWFQNRRVKEQKKPTRSTSGTPESLVDSDELDEDVDIDIIN